MASSTDGNNVSASPQENEADSVRNESSQLLEVLDGRLDELREKTELCDAILRDLVDLVDLAKKLHDKVESTKQGPSH
ncbi:hypothetical protein AAFF_G00330160 [Aldrovandia affinis]|uniref:Uncharacterized protein n=1 Tax=Aldrovandia affinis TaxID=143900 RepID=A0AAD7SM16_9TELE|nr:hypothetical protein AAFF_G00330160 [Aldrovandia affinis]